MFLGGDLVGWVTTDTHGAAGSVPTAGRPGPPPAAPRSSSTTTTLLTPCFKAQGNITLPNTGKVFQWHYSAHATLCMQLKLQLACHFLSHLSARIFF